MKRSSSELMIPGSRKDCSFQVSGMPAASRRAVAGLLCLICTTGWLHADDSPKRLVVVLYPQNNDGSPGNFLVDQAIRSTLLANSDEAVEVYNEYLDVAFPMDARGQELQIEYLRQKYSSRGVDVVIAGLSTALDFALANRDVFHRAPVAFCAVDERELAARRLPADVIGVPIHFDLTQTLKVVRSLQPGTRSITVVAGTSTMDVAWMARARQEFASFGDQLEFEFLTDLTLEEFVQECSNRPADSVIYYIHVFQDAEGAALVPSHVLDAIAQRANVPIYGHVGTYVGRGIVGGCVMDFENEGRNAARLALRMLAGERPEDIGVQPVSRNSYVFDARQLEHWQLAEASLPDGSEVRFRDARLWEQYRWQLIAGLAIGILQSALIVSLVIQRATRRAAQERLRNSATQLRQLSGRLIRAQETERRRIAGELHDDFNQRLALVSVEMDLLRQHPPETPDQLRSQLGELGERIRQLSTSIHDLSHQLHPLKIEQIGLAAIRGLCRDMSHAHGLKITFEPGTLPDDVPPPSALCMYRIVQEGLRNVVRHSGAAEATVRSGIEDGELRLTIEDSGKGFDPATTGDGLGLISMRERLRTAGGSLRIESRPSAGTRLTAAIRLPPPQSHACPASRPQQAEASSEDRVRTTSV